MIKNESLERQRKLAAFHEKLTSMETKKEYIEFFRKFLKREGYTIRDEYEEKEITLMKSRLKDLSSRDQWQNHNSEYIKKMIKTKI